MLKSMSKLLVALMLAVTITSALSSVASAKELTSTQIQEGIDKLVYDNYKKGIYVTKFIIKSDVYSNDNWTTNIRQSVPDCPPIQQDDEIMGNYTSVTITASVNTWWTASQLKAIKDSSSKIINVAEKFKSVKDQVGSINDQIVKMCVYDINKGNAGSSYDSLVDRRATCEGYAEGFKLVCTRMGIPCVLAYSKDHAWNEVYISGKWTMVDVTWNDAPGCLRKYFLVPELTLKSKGLTAYERIHHILNDDSNADFIASKEFLVPGSTNTSANFDISKYLVIDESVAPVMAVPVGAIPVSSTPIANQLPQGSVSEVPVQKKGDIVIDSSSNAWGDSVYFNSTFFYADSTITLYLNNTEIGQSSVYNATGPARVVVEEKYNLEDYNNSTDKLYYTVQRAGYKQSEKVQIKFLDVK
ncbi:hypothetical protein K2F43_20650 [Clostridium estertheticum]|uniref:transglutaminase domain-containing protein n=1 Tax=Clostridium estertheticum TaxID=238834 RepID=UPI001C6E8512|nr:transglutaminase domain-containing protein [Clostridium estertheticum]MBW9173599.1 hypothetical protein [Clostridium estertheticum]WLC75232.1 hypothetical protein KTC99_21370 [Clostridium estertheticum]